MPIFRYNETAGNYYAYLIEGHGDDANDGLTPETAVATLDRLVEILDTYAGASRRHAVIVKKRIYNEGVTYARTDGKPITFEFVGGCEIDGNGPAYFTIINNDYVIKGNFIDYTGGKHIATLPDGSHTYYYYCSFNNVDGIHANTYLSHVTSSDAFFYDCIIKDSNPVVTSTTVNWNRAGNFQRCVFYNAKKFTNGLGSLYIYGKNNIIYNCPSLPVNTSSTFDYCCIYGDLDNKDNAAWQALGKNLNGIGTNPQFTDPTNGQYTVNQSSPCLYRGEGGDHIGIGEGFYLQANILYFQQSAINNFQLTTGRFGFIDPLDNAFIETNPIDIGQIITLESAELAAILPMVAGEFTAGPVHYSHWYPPYSAASTYHKGAGVADSAILYRSLVDNNLNNTPASSATEWERLTWESGVSYAAGKIVQYTDDKWYKANTATSTSWVAGEWDEVVMTREWNLQVKTGRTYDEAVAADWATIPYNVTPLLDTAGKGNSDDAYDPLTAAVMVFRFIAVRIDAKTIV